MIRNRSDFYFSDNAFMWSDSTMPRLIAVVDAWLSCSVKIYREGFELMMALSRCRGINSQYVAKASAQIERYLKTIMKHNRDLERSWRRDPVNPQPGPVLVCEFHQPTLDEDGVPVAAVDFSVTVGSTDEEIMSLVRRHYNEMKVAMEADTRAHVEDIIRAASLSLLEQDDTNSSEEDKKISMPVEHPSVSIDPVSSDSLDVSTEQKPVRNRRHRSNNNK